MNILGMIFPAESVCYKDAGEQKCVLDTFWDSYQLFSDLRKIGLDLFYLG